jgi:formylglycine-generating enzyme required for sulfatase activity
MAKNWAITIGINRYQWLRSLQYATTDADAMRQLFLAELGFEQVVHFTDTSAPIPQDYGPDLVSQPTYTTLKRFLRERFNQPFLGNGDNLWFFFAGHGIRHQQRDYLMPSDGDRADLPNSAIPIHYIAERLRNSGADNVILLIDACRSYEGRRDGVGIGEERQQGVITLYSCSPEESSYEIEELRQGAFTHILLQSLRLQGEGNCATVERLYQRLRTYVPRLTRQYKRDVQTPYGAWEPPSKNHLILLPRQATLGDVMALKLDAQQAEIERNLTAAEQLWIRVLTVSPGDPQALAGIKRIYQGTAPTSVPISPPDQKAIKEFKVATFDTQTQRIRIEKKQAEFCTEEIADGITLDLMVIPGGTFAMGSPEGEGDDDEKPQHEVTVEPFLMGTYAVTQAQWKAVVNLPKVDSELQVDPARFKGSNRPVETVSWNDAVEFCKRLSQHTGREYRLPTEAEWEYACRAGTTTPFHTGKTLTSDLANYDATEIYGDGFKGEYREQTTDVGSFPANAFGLYDVHGNVWEWCQDHWHKNYADAPTDGSAWLSTDENASRLIRGGSWIYYPSYCRSAYRINYTPDLRYYSFGFRVSCSAPRT